MIFGENACMWSQLQTNALSVCNWDCKHFHWDCDHGKGKEGIS